MGALGVSPGRSTGMGEDEDDDGASGWVMTAADSIPAARSRRYTRVVSSRMSCCSLRSSLLSLFNITPRGSSALSGRPDYIVILISERIANEVSPRIPDFRVVVPPQD